VKLHKLAEECMDLAGRFADPKLEKELLHANMEDLFRKVRIGGVFLRKPDAQDGRLARESKKSRLPVRRAATPRSRR